MAWISHEISSVGFLELRADRVVPTIVDCQPTSDDMQHHLPKMKLSAE
eukprot:SAG31_NODE_38287_length_297_cov_1.005051_1_plen_47_part_10